MRLTEQELIKRKDKILRTAYRLFCDFGVDGVTLAQIAKESNVGASAIYRYFGTKANVLWLTQKILWKEIVEQINADGEKHLLSAKNGFEEISILLHRFELLYTQHESYLLFSNEYRMYLIRHRVKLQKHEYDEFMQPVYQLFQSALKKGRADGSIDGTETIDDQFFSIWGIMRSFTDQIVIYDNMYEGDNPWKDRFKLVYQYLLKALKK